MTTENLITIRRMLLGAAGLVCLGYGLLAVMSGRPDPVSAWIPGSAGVLAAIGITLAAMMAGTRRADQAFDEGYDAEKAKAYAYSFWFAVALYPLFGLALAFGAVEYPVVFAAMGTLTGGVFLTLNVLFDVRAS